MILLLPQISTLRAAGELKNADGIRAVVQDKSSLTQRGNPFAFKLSDNGFEWIGNYDISADELLDGMKRKSDKDRAKDYILETLANGCLDANTIYKNAYEQILYHRFLLDLYP